MNKDELEISMSIHQFLESFQKLKTIGVLKNQKEFTSQLGEWIASIIYKGELSTNGKQKHWDLKVGNKYYQIKTQAKSFTTKRRDTDFTYPENALIDFVIIIVFDEFYKLEKIYKVPFIEAYKLVDRSNKYFVLRWKDLEEDYLENIDVIMEQNPILKILKKSILL